MRDIIFEDVYTTDRWGHEALYRLLEERAPEQNISHQTMPTWPQHLRFIAIVPYPHWYLISDRDMDSVIGATYITFRREVGIFVFKAHQGKGYGSAALAKLREVHPGPMLANINPANEHSIAFFTKHGARLIQHTYELG